MHKFSFISIYHSIYPFARAFQSSLVFTVTQTNTDIPVTTKTSIFPSTYSNISKQRCSHKQYPFNLKQNTSIGYSLPNQKCNTQSVLANLNTIHTYRNVLPFYLRVWARAITAEFRCYKIHTRQTQTRGSNVSLSSNFPWPKSNKLLIGLCQ